MAGVVSIPAEAPFAATLARGLLAEHGPRGLARLRLVLPSRRACLVMQEAFLDANAGAPLLPPRLVPVGDAAGELGLLDAAAEWGVPPALGDLQRRFLLFELVRRVQSELPDEQAFRLADALRELIDELDQEDVPVTALAGLEAGDAPEHWQRIARFLDLLAGTWGAIEREAGGIGRVARRGRLLTEVAARWREQDPGPVVVAGVTGSVPAVAALMATVAALPGGRVVLPGVDPAPAPGLAEATGPAHPQWGFARLLERLGLTLQAVPSWPDDLAAGDQRRRLLGAMTTPATLTPPAVDLDRALAGVEIVEAPDVGSEALAVALRLRELLETDGRALVVAPDRQLARRIAAELERFDLAVEDSAGQPLDQTAPGSFALLVAHAALDPDPVVPALAVLKHPLARAGRDAATCRRLARALERTGEAAAGRGVAAGAGERVLEHGERRHDRVGVEGGVRHQQRETAGRGLIERLTGAVLHGEVEALELGGDAAGELAVGCHDQGTAVGLQQLAQAQRHRECLAPDVRRLDDLDARERAVEVDGGRGEGRRRRHRAEQAAALVAGGEVVGPARHRLEREAQPFEQPRETPLRMRRARRLGEPGRRGGVDAGQDDATAGQGGDGRHQRRDGGHRAGDAGDDDRAGVLLAPACGDLRQEAAAARHPTDPARLALDRAPGAGEQVEKPRDALPVLGRVTGLETGQRGDRHVLLVELVDEFAQGVGEAKGLLVGQLGLDAADQLEQEKAPLEIAQRRRHAPLGGGVQEAQLTGGVAHRHQAGRQEGCAGIGVEERLLHHQTGPPARQHEPQPREPARPVLGEQPAGERRGERRFGGDGDDAGHGGFMRAHPAWRKGWRRRRRPGVRRRWSGRRSDRRRLEAGGEKAPGAVDALGVDAVAEAAADLPLHREVEPLESLARRRQGLHRHDLVEIAVHQQQGRLGAELVGQELGTDEGTRAADDTGERRLVARRDVQRGHRALREAEERAALGGEAALVALGVQERRDVGGGPLHPLEQRVVAAVHQAEPLPAHRRHVAGLGCVRREKGGVRQITPQHRRQADEVVAVGADAVQEDHERRRGTTRGGFDDGSFERAHGGLPRGGCTGAAR